jgi:hypothetical protein
VTDAAFSPKNSNLLAISFLLYIGAMRWTVATLNDAVNAEIEALPNDMRARLVRLSSIIEQVGFQGLPRRPGRDFACDLSHGCGPACRDRPGLCEEHSEDAAA